MILSSKLYCRCHDETTAYCIKETVNDSRCFSLGCYSGEPITVISKRKGGMTVAIKDGRYNIDNDLASAITVKE